MKWNRTISMMPFLLLAGKLPADTITLPAMQSGWYEQNGVSSGPSNSNYLSGWEGLSSGQIKFQVNIEFRDFFIFDLTGLAGQITAAQLQLFNPLANPGLQVINGYQSPDATETYSLFDVGTTAGTLGSGGGGVAAFADLGSGINYGSATVSTASNGTLVTVTLDPAAIGALNARGGLFALGGAVTTLTRTPDVNEFVFADTFFPPDLRQLVLTTEVPEPATFWLPAIALAGLFGHGLLKMLRRA